MKKKKNGLKKIFAFVLAASMIMPGNLSYAVEDGTAAGGAVIEKTQSGNKDAQAEKPQSEDIYAKTENAQSGDMYARAENAQSKDTEAQAGNAQSKDMETQAENAQSDKSESSAIKEQPEDSVSNKEDSTLDIPQEEDTHGIQSEDGNFTYNIDEEGNAYIIKYIGSNTSISVPKTLGGVNVTRIMNTAFAGNENIRYVYLPSTLKKLDPGCFENCTYLFYVSMSKVTDIGEYCFKGCKRLDPPELSDELTLIPNGCFSGCADFETVSIPVSVTIIGDNAFEDCTKLKTVLYKGSNEEYNAIITGAGNDSFVHADVEYNSETSDWEYELDENSKAMITHYNGPQEDELTIPATVEGHEVRGVKSYGGSGTPIYLFDSYMHVDKINVSEGISELGEYCFAGLDVDEVTIPSTVTEIGYKAFCNSLLKNIAIPETIKLVDEEAFSYCDELEEVIIPSSVTQMKEGVFKGCANLKKVEINADIKDLPKNSFLDCDSLTDVKLPEGLETVGESSFAECNLLGSLTLPDTVKSIEKNAFQYCYGLEKINLGSNLSEIGEYAFESCSELDNISLPDSLTKIDSGAFSYTGIKELYIPSGITSLDSSAFIFCSEVEKLEIGEGYEELPIELEDYYNLRTVVLPSTIKKINDNDFAYCSSLETINMPEGVLEIGNYAFCGCDLLKEFTINPDIGMISDCAFRECISLRNMYIYRGVTYIESDAFDFNRMDIWYEGTKEEWASIYSGPASSTIRIHYDWDPDKPVEAAEYDYVLSGDGTSAEISCYYGDDEEVIIPSTAEIEGIAYPVKSIAGGAFKDNRFLRSVTIPEGVTDIDYGAFTRCYNLISVEIPDTVEKIGDYAFSECSMLEAAVIPEGVTTIGEKAFQSCTSLTSLKMPASVTEIKNNAFAECSGIKNIETEVTEGELELGYYAFSNCQNLEKVKLGRYLKYAGEGVFSGCESLKEVDFVSGAKLIGDAMFSGCAKLEEVKNIGVVKEIGEKAFSDCTSLKSFTFPEEVTDIKNETFSGCKNLETVVFADGIKFIGNYAFNGCESLEKVDISSTGVTGIGEYAFYDCVALNDISFPSVLDTLGERALGHCKALKSFNVPNKVHELSEGLFFECTSLESVNLAGEINSMGISVFNGCSSLTELKWDYEPMLAAIPESTFSGCSSLVSVTLPAVTEIEKSAFKGCSSLSNIISYGGIEKLGDNAFDGCTSLRSYDYTLSLKAIGYSCFRRSGITHIFIPDTITKIPSSCFSECGYLASITLPNKITDVQIAAFDSCKSLKDVYYNGTEEDWDKVTIYYGNDKLKSAAKHFGDESTDKSLYYEDFRYEQIGTDEVRITGYFGGNEVFIPESILEYKVREIGDDVFNGTGITKASLPYTIKNMPGFKGCKNLTYVEVRDDGGYIDIPDDCFNGCISLRKAKLLSVSYIGSKAFEGCTKLVDVEFSPNLSSMGSDAFRNCASLEKLEMRNCIISDLPSCAFYDCGSLEYAVLPDPLTMLGSSTFKNCVSLRSVVIQQSLGTGTISNYAFYNCPSLKNVYYNGTESDWKNLVSIEDGNDDFKNAIFNEEYKGITDLTFDRDSVVMNVNDTAEVNITGIVPASSDISGIEYNTVSERVTVKRDETDPGKAEIKAVSPGVARIDARCGAAGAYTYAYVKQPVTEAVYDTEIGLTGLEQETYYLIDGERMYGGDGSISVYSLIYHIPKWYENSHSVVRCDGNNEKCNSDPQFITILKKRQTDKYPDIIEITENSIILEKYEGFEYRLYDGEKYIYNTTGEFTDLKSKCKYTLESRQAKDDEYEAGEWDVLTATTMESKTDDSSSIKPDDSSSEETGSSSSSKPGDSSSAKGGTGSSSSKPDDSSSDTGDSGSSSKSGGSSSDAKDQDSTSAAASSEMKWEKITFSAKDESGKNVQMDIGYISGVTYNGMKHISNLDKPKNKTVQDISIAVSGNLIKLGTPVVKFKNNKNAAKESDAKAPYFTLSFKASKGIKPGDKKLLKAVNKELKARVFKFIINPADLKETVKDVKLNKAGDKVTGVTAVVNGQEIKLSKKDYTAVVGSGRVTLTGTGNFTGTAVKQSK